MALVYEQASNGALRQAEILGPIVDYQAVLDQGNGDDPKSTRRRTHHRVIVMSQECDLEHDFETRYPNGQEPLSQKEAEESGRTLLHVLLCDIYAANELSELQPDFKAKIFKRIEDNQMERYHYLGKASVFETADEVGPLFIDFRKYLAAPCGEVYDQLASESSQRIARLPAYYLHDLAQRFHSYLARIAIPD